VGSRNAYSRNKRNGNRALRSPSATQRGRQRKLSPSSLPERSQFARDRALHVLADLRRSPNLSPTHAAKLEGVRLETVRKYFPSALRKSGRFWRVTKSDRFVATLYLPDREGNPVPVHTRSSKERREASAFLRDRGRYLGGDRAALVKWQGKTIAGVELVTDERVIKATEPALSGFSLYRTFNGGAA
jgi:hypothetical protein